MGPIIGILTRSGVNENGTPVEYCMESTRRAIIKAGGVPIMLTPPQDINAVNLRIIVKNCYYFYFVLNLNKRIKMVVNE